MRKRTLILLGTSFLLFLVAAIIRFVSFHNMREYTREVEWSRDLIVSLEKLSNHLKSAQLYTADSSQGEEYTFFKKYRDEQAMIPGELEQITALVRRYDEKQQALWHVVDQTVRKHLPILLEKNISAIAHSEDRWRLGALLRINTTIAFMVQHEEAVLDTKKSQLDRALAWTDGVSFALVLIALLIFGITFTHNLKLSKKERWLEGFLSSVLHTSQAGIVSYRTMRERGRIAGFSVAFLNEAVAPLLGLEDAQSEQTKHALEQFVWEANLFQHFVTVAETGNKMELETPYGQGSQQRWLQLLLARRDDGVTLSIHDISAIKQYQEDLKNSIAQLERSNAELEQYAYAASHDLQEPLRKIATFGHLLHDTQAEKLDEKGKNYLDKIITSAARMTALIRDLLNFSSLKRKTDFETVNLQEILDSVLQDLELVIAQKDALIKADPLPAIEAIPLQMHQLFYNLCNNALKFSSPNRKPEIRITCSRATPAEKARMGLPPNRHFLRLMVADNGIGFDKTHALQIFGLFKRLNNKELYNGSGIGLALCKRVMENHQGLIFAESDEGSGARFYLLLPETQTGMQVKETELRNIA